MKTRIIISGIFTLILAGLGFSPVGETHGNLLFGGLILAGLATLLSAFLPGASTPRAIPGVPNPPPPPAVEPEKPANVEPPPPPAPPRLVAETGVVTFLGVMQEKGRLLDFLMDDITPYTDAQVGAAARVVHQGCKAALKEHVAVSAVADGSEGQSFTVPAEAPKEHFRLLGNVSGQPPFTGTLVHKGWKAETVKLPRALADGDKLPVIAPAQIELK
jgi:hypothetical protein